MKTARVFVFVAVMTSLMAAMTPLVYGAEAAGIRTFEEFADYYLQQRAWIAPIIPPFLTDTLDYFNTQIAKGDYSFQERKDWYFSYKDGPLAYAPGGEIGQSISGGEYLIVYEDLKTASTRIVSTEGKLLAEFKAEQWPNLATLSKAAYDTRFLAELNKRSIALWVLFQNNEPDLKAKAAEVEAGGGMMMLMGGETEMEVVDIGATNNGMAVTFAWPAWFTNRLDIYSFDGGGYNGFGSWKLAEIGYSTTGTNRLRWLDSGQLGRGLPTDAEVRLYTGGSDKDSDGDGYSDSFEQLTLNSNPTNGDTDGDNVSDGPFDPDNTGPIVAGPDAFPLDASEWLDTDGDGIGDNADTDDDGDGKPDSVETNTLQRLMPITIAPFKTVSVQNVDPANDDNDSEEFDVASAGRMLPYAAGGDSRGFGQLHGGIFFNHDASNLYIGVAGFEKGGDNALYLFLDTDGTNGGVSSLSGVSGQPNGFGIANNLSFSASLFKPNVGLLLGSRFGDGQNYWSFGIGGVDFGQGVFGLSNNLVYNWPGFSNAVGGFISQWGDRGNDSANAGIEVAISLNSLGLSNGSVFKAAAIIAGGPSGDNRWFSGECYGESASGKLTNNDFRDGAVTLIGAEVYLSATPAPESSGPPPFTDDDVMLQGYYWKVPRVALSNYTGVSVVGNFNNWAYGTSPMTLVGNYTWERIQPFPQSTNLQLKFRTNTTNWWGSTNYQRWVTLPVINGNGLGSPGSDIWLTNVVGTVRFRACINGGNSTFTAEYVSPTNVTRLLPGFTTNFWYPELTAKAQNGQLTNFTMVWLGPPQKCNSGRDSVGYDPFDYYDVGTYAEKFSVETRYGSEAQLKNCVNVLRSRGILPIVDLVMNHMNGGYDRESGSGRYNYQPEYHETFEKPDPAGNNSNQFFNVNYANKPFSYDEGFGNPDGVNPWDGAATSADVNQRHPYIRQGLKNWATWVSANVGYRGYRWDVAQYQEPWLISELMNCQVMKGQFGVMEYWTTTNEATVAEFETWIELTDRRAAMFDQLLYSALQDMCNRNGDFNMSLLKTAGLNSVKPQWAVTLAGDHDKVRPYGEGNPAKVGIITNKMMAFAFILISEGLPMIDYNSYFIGPYADPNPPNDPVDDGWTGAPLQPQIDPLIDARRKFAGGGTAYLSTAYTNDLFIMKRTGNEKKPGCILVLNDHPTETLSNTVNTGWANTRLTDFINTNYWVDTYGNGNAPLSAPPRGYRVIVRQSDL